MKRVVASGSQPNKTKLRQQFIELAKEIRSLSKFEFVQLLANNDLQTAQQWIDDLSNLVNTFYYSSQEAIQYLAVEVFCNGDSVGYVKNHNYTSGARGSGSRTNIYITEDITEAEQFASYTEIKNTLESKYIIYVYDADNGIVYRYEPYSRNWKPGELISTYPDYNHYYATVELKGVPV